MILDVPRITESVRDSLTSQESATIYNLTKKRYEYYDGTNWCPFHFGIESGESTGFPIDSSGEVDRTSSMISFDNGSRTFTIQPANSSFIFMIKGKLFKKTSAQTQTITDTEGLWYFYFDETGTLQKTSTFTNDLILKYCYVAYVYWDAENNIAIHFGDERHGLTMDSHSHIWKHATHGAAYISGLGLSDFNFNAGALAIDVQFAVGSGYIRDEDILHTIPTVTSTTGLRVLYRIGASSSWRRGFQSGYSALSYGVGDRLAYNQYTGGAWQLTEVTNNKFVCYHIVATNDVNYPVMAIMGEIEYGSKADARAGANTEINNLSGLPFYEFRFIGTILYQTSNSYSNALKAKIVTTDTGADYVDWRFTALQPTTATTNVHNNLGGIDNAPYYHSNQPIKTTDNVQFANLTLTGNLIVNGETTNINTTNLVVEDKNIILGDVTTPSDTTADGGGITLKGLSDKTFNWVDATDSWTSSENINLISGKTFKINNVDVLTSSQILGKSLPTGTVVGTTDEQTLTNKTLQSFTITGNITSTGTGIDFNLIDNNASSLSFDTTGKLGLLEIDTTDGSEKVKMSGGLEVTGTTILKGLTYPTTDGTNGQAVVTNGSGTLSFATISGGGGSSITFTSSVDFALGSPVYFNGSSWVLAIANLDTTTVQYVISGKTGSGTISYTALASGELTLTTAQWDSITGGSGGLTTGSSYFLSSSTAGRISTTVGLIYSPVLRAISTTKAFISLSINSIESGMGDTFYRETTTTVANTVSVTLLYPPAGKAYVWLSIDGVIQSGIDFDLSGNTITLGATVPSGTLIDILYARAVLLSDTGAINKMVSFSETVTASAKTVFNLPIAPSGVNSCLVFVGGAIQDTSKFNLSGNVLTMTDLVPIGVQIVVYVLNSSGVSNSIDSFVTRQTYSLSINGTVNVSTVFGNQVSGLYRFFDINDPRIGGTVSLKHYGIDSNPDIRVNSDSSSVSSSQGTSGKLNVYVSSFILTFQNNTSNTISLRVYRET